MEFVQDVHESTLTDSVHTCCQSDNLNLGFTGGVAKDTQ